MHIQSV